jgi:ABC-type Fe3+/spermidine/putrescine transport system ATPase subunit
MSDRIAVMDRGKIVQVGAPPEIYMRPATRFVAEFVGLASFAPGRVVGLDGEEVEVDAGVGRLRVGCPERRPSAGQAVVLVIRPEALRLDAGAPSPGAVNRIAGTVVTWSFLGGIARYWIDVGAPEPWIADVHAAAERPPLAGPVTVEVAGRQVHLLPG